MTQANLGAYLPLTTRRARHCETSKPRHESARRRKHQNLYYIWNGRPGFCSAALPEVPLRAKRQEIPRVRDE